MLAIDDGTVVGSCVILLCPASVPKDHVEYPDFL